MGTQRQIFFKENSLEDLSYETSLLSISDFLYNSSNYKIYHSLDDYLVNQSQLKKLKSCAGNKAVLVSNGSHLGFMYTPEFLTDLKKEIALNAKVALKQEWCLTNINNKLKKH